MNKNTIAGFVLIGLILIGFSWYNTRVFERQQREQFVADSIAKAEALKNAPQVDSSALTLDSINTTSDSLSAVSIPTYKDSLLEIASGKAPEFFTLENV